MDLGGRLRELRRKHNYSLYDVERRIGLHFSTIAKYERNERQPGIDVLKDLAALYNVPLGALLTDVDDLAELLTERQRRLLTLLDRRPPVAQAVERLARMSDGEVTALVGFLDAVLPPPPEEPQEDERPRDGSGDEKGRAPGPQGDGIQYR
ncbi:MAG TPA: helix-turn-helix transcriptional regulator [Sphingobacteriaceae bacterium]|nr:helix-turn-helix transcriptional regulator [Sphingobacteriaceae bacterium]